MKRDCGFISAHESRFPDAQLLFAPGLLRFDHEQRSVQVVTIEQSPELGTWAGELGVRLRNTAQLREPSSAPLPRCRPRLTAAQHRDRVQAAKQEIYNGESYEICLTDILAGEPIADPLEYYRGLRRRNPTAYSAFLKLDGAAIACSSPERFLRIDGDRTVTSKPIKGTAPSSTDARELLASGKENAEHLMIVDLVRNDLGQVCDPCSVSVPVFRDIETYARVHQMVSTVSGKLRDGLRRARRDSRRVSTWFDDRCAEGADFGNSRWAGSGAPGNLFGLHWMDRAGWNVRSERSDPNRSDYS